MNRADFLLKAETWLNDPGFYTSHDGPAEILVREALELLKKDEWVPCSERLPDEPGKYLVFAKAGSSERFAEDHFNGASWESLPATAKAWRPLPEPYGEVE